MKTVMDFIRFSAKFFLLKHFRKSYLIANFSHKLSNSITSIENEEIFFLDSGFDAQMVDSKLSHFLLQRFFKIFLAKNKDGWRFFWRL